MYSSCIFVTYVNFNRHPVKLPYIVSLILHKLYELFGDNFPDDWEVSSGHYGT